MGRPTIEEILDETLGSLGPARKKTWVDDRLAKMMHELEEDAANGRLPPRPHDILMSQNNTPEGAPTVPSMRRIVSAIGDGIEAIFLGAGDGFANSPQGRIMFPNRKPNGPSF